MQIIKSFINKLFGANSRLSDLESIVLQCVRRHLTPQISKYWDNQVEAINKIQRLPNGVEVNFYRMKNGVTSFDEALAFPNKTTELLVAKVLLELPNMGKLVAKVWCVKGFLFSIEYEGNVSYFEEAAGMDPRPEWKISCKLINDLDTIQIHDNPNSV